MASYQTFLVEDVILPETIHRLAARRTKNRAIKQPIPLNVRTQYELSYPITLFRWSSNPDTIVERAAAGLQHLAPGRLVRHSAAGPKPRNCRSVEKLAWHPRAKHENPGANQNAEAAQQHVGRRRQQ